MVCLGVSVEENKFLGVDFCQSEKSWAYSCLGKWINGRDNVEPMNVMTYKGESLTMVVDRINDQLWFEFNEGLKLHAFDLP